MHEVYPEFRTAVQRVPRRCSARRSIRFVHLLLGLARSLVHQPPITRLGIEVRAGAQTGEVTFGHNDQPEIGVHVAARRARLAGTCEVWACSTVNDRAAGSVLTLEDVGEHELEGVPDRWRLYRGTP